MSANPPVLLGKRKRAVVSYREPVASEIDETEPEAEADWDYGKDVDDDGHDAYNTRRKKSSKKAPPKKKRKAWVVKKPAKGKSFRFLDLPAELRDMIYELTFTDPNGVGIIARQAGHRHIAIRGRVYAEDAYSHRYGRRRRLQARAAEIAPISTSFVPALLAVNKQINTEGINYLYGQDFIFEDTTALHSFLAPIGTRNQQRLENIDVLAWGRSGVSKGNNHSALTLLAGATNLKSLRLMCDVSYGSNSPVRTANRVFGDAHWFLEAYGAANDRKDAAIDILELDASNFRRRTWSPNTEDRNVLIQRFKAALSALLGVKPSKKLRK